MLCTPRRAPGVRTLLVAAACALAPLAAHAANDDTIATDRPDFVESSKVVGKGRFQVETSVAVERDRNDMTRDRTIAMPTLLRYGLSDAVELRLETDGRTIRRSSELLSGQRSTLAGYADTSLGAKWHVLDEQAGGPSVGVLLHADLPSGSRELRGQGVRPSLRIVAEWELPDDLSLGLMPGLGMERNDHGSRYSYGILGAVLGKSFSDRLRGFVEIAAPQLARGANGGTVARFDVGGAWLMSRNVQIDTAIARGLNSRSPDWSWTAGLSFKL